MARIATTTMISMNVKPRSDRNTAVLPRTVCMSVRTDTLT